MQTLSQEPPVLSVEGISRTRQWRKEKPVVRLEPRAEPALRYAPMAEPAAPEPIPLSQQCTSLRDFALYFEVSRRLSKSLDLEKVLGPVLEFLTAALHFERAKVCIAEMPDGELEANFDDYAEDAKSAWSDGGDEILQWVQKTGKPVAIQCGPEKPHGTMLLCVPILIEDRVRGTLSAERAVLPAESVDENLRRMEGVASILARAIWLRRHSCEQETALYRENLRLREYRMHHFRPAGMIGDSDAMRAVYQEIARISQSDSAVLIRGEKGTGKKEVARALYEASLRRGKAWIKVDCATLPEGVIENRGAGDDAGGLHTATILFASCLKMAHGGTLFLDHIECLPLAVQRKLLGVLKNGEFEQVGELKAFPCEVRLIAATSADLETLVEEEKFRRDLFVVLNGGPVYVPALRERHGDILQLATHFLEQFNAQQHKKIRRISTATVDLLLAYGWPGNVAEMSACFENAVHLCSGDMIRANHFPQQLYAPADGKRSETGLLANAIEALEHDMIVEALKTNRGNIAKAARQLGTTERIMGCRVKQYALDMSRFSDTPARG